MRGPVWIIVNYDDSAQPIYGVYATHETAVDDYRGEYAEFPNVRLEEWSVL